MIQPGDYIQWTSAGYAVFSEPRKVRELSECGQFVFVGEEKCGLPIEQCTKHEFITEVVTPETFTFFWNGPFSQWHICKFKLDNVEYNCAEQWMMASKARFFKDDLSLRKILKANDPREQKRLGREVANFIEDKWNGVARDVVYRGNEAKFIQNPKLKEVLLKTKGTTLVEASPYDQVWGIGLRESDPRALDRKTWKGKNWLGQVLTALRDELIKSPNGIKLDKNEECPVDE